MIGKLFSSLGNDFELSKEQINIYPKQIIKQFETLAIIKARHSLSYFCNQCNEYHQYSRIKDCWWINCPESRKVRKVDDEHRLRYFLDWKHLKNYICLEVNDLKPANNEFKNINECFGIGMTAINHAVLLINPYNLNELAHKIKELKVEFQDNYAGYILFTLKKIDLNTEQQAFLKSNNVSTQSMEELINNGFSISEIQTKEIKDADCKTVLKGKTLTINNEERLHTIDLKQDYLVAICRNFINSQTIPIKNKYIEVSTNVAQYKQNYELGKEVSKLNCHIRKQYPEFNNDKQFILLSGRGKGYVLNPLYLPAKIAN